MISPAGVNLGKCFLRSLGEDEKDVDERSSEDKNGQDIVYTLAGVGVTEDEGTEKSEDYA